MATNEDRDRPERAGAQADTPPETDRPPPRAASSPGRDLLAAVAFLTVLPLPRSITAGPVSMLRMTAYFPIVGYLLGGLLALGAWFLRDIDAGLRAALLLAGWLALTGMLHLDGLLDCADALLSSKPAAERLQILRDARIGTFAFGVGAVYLLLKWQALRLTGDPWLLAFVPVLARFAILVPMRRYPAARTTGLAAESGRGRWVTAALFTLPAFVLFPAAGASALLVATLGAAWAARRLGGGLTGDVYGALIDLGELVALFAGLASQI